MTVKEQQSCEEQVKDQSETQSEYEMESIQEDPVPRQSRSRETKQLAKTKAKLSKN